METRKVEVLPSRLRQVPLGQVGVGTVVFGEEMFTALMIERPDADGVARVASLMGPGVRGTAKRVVEMSANQVSWEVDLASGGTEIRSQVIAPGARDRARVLILLPEETPAPRRRKRKV